MPWNCCLTERVSPAGVDAHDHDEQVEREQQMDGLQDLDDLLGTTAIEIIDVQYDPVDPARARVVAAFLAPVVQQLHQVLEVFPDRGDEPELT